MDVQWIKISTDVFDNRKIKQIEAMPEGDTILVIWFKLLCMAGTVNDNGLVYLTREIPYTDEMLANQFNKPLNVVRPALQVFEQFEMIEIIDDFIFLPSWEKYRSVDQLAKIQERNRLRKQRQRERQRVEALPESCEVTGLSRDCHVTVTGLSRDCPVTEKEKVYKKKKNIDIDIDNIDIDIDIDTDTEKEKIYKKKKSTQNQVRHQHGCYKNVLLSDEEFAKLTTEFPNDYSERIERLSEYIAMTGKSYKNHLAVMRAWARKENQENDTRKRTNNLGAASQQGSMEALGDYY